MKLKNATLLVLIGSAIHLLLKLNHLIKYRFFSLELFSELVFFIPLIVFFWMLYKKQ